MALQLLINEPPLQVLPRLARAIGLNEAIVLQQVHYWLDPRFNQNRFDGRYWAANAGGHWRQRFPFRSERTLRRTIKNLETSGLLLSCTGGQHRQTRFYTINYDLLEQIGLADIQLSFPGKEREKEEGQGDGEEESFPLQLQGPAETGGDAGSHGHPACPEDERGKDGGHGPLGPRSNVLYPTWPKRPSRPVMPPFGQSGQVIWLPWAAPPSKEEEGGPANGGFGQGNADEGQVPMENSGTEKQQEEDKILSEMLEIWNQTVQATLTPGQDARMTEKRKAFLRQFLNVVFVARAEGEKLDAWKGFCRLIANSRFLMGRNASGFRATLDWALVPHNAYKILEGAIYDQPEPIPQGKLQGELQGQFAPRSWEAFSENLANAVPQGPYREEWLQISRRLAGTLGQARYKAWLLSVYLEKVEGATAILCVKGRFTREYIENHFQSAILQAIQTVYPDVTCLELNLAPLSTPCPGDGA